MKATKMQINIGILLLVGSLACSSCESDAPEVDMPPSAPTVTADLYWPPNAAMDWVSVDPQDLAWDTDKLVELEQFLASRGTRAFIMLYKGKIVAESYWGQNAAETAPFGQASLWYWASAGKSLTAVLTGLAQEEGLLNIDDPTHLYLGRGWTDLDQEQESVITIRHQLTMTTGFEFEVDDLNCTLPECLRYRAEAGQQWYYHNAPYTLLEDVLVAAAGTDYSTFTKTRLGDKIGMEGLWIPNGSNNLFWSTARDAARFGLLMLNEGKWDNQVVIGDEAYFDEMINSSQSLNPSYGYLWWLNGKSSLRVPGLATALPIEATPSAPDDMFSAIGKNGQFVDIVPSLDLVVVRFGDASDESLVPITFHEDMWERLGQVF
ncbi:MAG: serine hydrolase [Bacteroidota bacterium]